MQYMALSEIYDRWMRRDLPPEDWIRALRALLCEHGIHPGARVADIACGTGAVTLPLARAGYRMLGCDRSPDMLSRARDKAAQAGQSGLIWVCQDMRTLDIAGEWDAVLCACDGVNYLTTPQEAGAFFDAAWRMLRPGGLLAFDISSREKLMAMDQMTYTMDEDDAACIWDNRLDPVTCVLRMELTLFLRRRGDCFERFEEVHIQRAHDSQEVAQWLCQAGFTHVRFQEAFTGRCVTKDSQRWLYRALKPD